jgi:hypothetical protein
MLRVFGEGDDVFRLENGAGARIGTIRGRAIGFRGFATEDDARDAAVAAWHAMNGALKREYPSWPHHALAVERLRTTHDGAYEWFYDGTRAIARLFRPARADGDGAHGIELLLPSYSSEAVAISAAHAMARAVAPYRDEPAASASAAATDRADSKEEDAAATAA